MVLLLNKKISYFVNSCSAGDDLADYRAGYPNQEDDMSLNDNFKFYNGEIESVPDGDYIDNIHLKWKGKYQKLEVHHG